MKGTKRNVQLQETLEAVTTLSSGMLDREIETTPINQAVILVEELSAILELAKLTAAGMEPSEKPGYLEHFLGLQRCRGELLDLIDKNLEVAALTMDERIVLTLQTERAVTTAMQELTLAGFVVSLPERPSYQSIRGVLGTTGDGIVEDLKKNEQRIEELKQNCSTGPQEYRRLGIGPRAYRCGSTALKSSLYWR